MATSSAPAKFTFDEYLKLEEQAQLKSEFRSGEIFAMAGGSEAHSSLAARSYELLRKLFPDCKARWDLKVFAPTVNEGMYPDVYVICREIDFYKGRKDTVLNPEVIVEVLSPSTRIYDLGAKASFYRTIPSVETILLIDSERQWIQRQKRIKSNWDLEEFTRSDQIVLAGGNEVATVAEFYEKIEI